MGRRWSTTAGAVGAAGDLSEVLGRDLAAARQEVDNLDPQLVLTDHEDLLVAEVCNRHVRASPVLHWAAMTRTAPTEVSLEIADTWDRGQTVHVKGTSLTITVPVEGEADLLRFRATQRYMAHVAGVVSGDRLVLEFQARTLTAEQIKGELDRTRQQLDAMATWIAADVGGATVTLEQQVRERLRWRKTRLLEHEGLDAALDIPVATAPEGARFPVPVTRKLTPISRRSSNAQFVAEPALDAAHYEDALRLTLSWARSLERSPETANKFDEEGLRDQLLMVLNSHFEGRGGAELFNGNGKTDILIRENDRNVFIAECKIWSGAKGAAAALDQLLGYLVWRDSKASLVMFLRVKDATQAIERLHEAVRTHPACRLVKQAGQPGVRADYVFVGDDEGRMIEVAVLPVVLGV